ncbi:MAG: hypothetical protein Q7T45_00330 [Bradyrhizobium sp.]|uniref:hypothetical protein n=1 Tax=Bradyrhizobium sp. TaxID=376 RepID=UPI0027179903|nr:hypothetical protein [Bradyrhizobium sp.]MDO8396245.1 hypothetical protein [Bradyrhizobium sp.]
MNMKDISANSVRLLLGIVSAGTVGAALEPAHASNDIFARPFLNTGAGMTIPAMVYDPALQMMVDPTTRTPVYEKNNNMQLAKVTAGCKDCPKYDE